MSDPARSPETEDDAGLGSNRGAARTTRRWVFAIAIIVAIALFALIVLLHLTGTIGPGAH